MSHLGEQAWLPAKLARLCSGNVCSVQRLGVHLVVDVNDSDIIVASQGSQLSNECRLAAACRCNVLSFKQPID